MLLMQPLCSGCCPCCNRAGAPKSHNHQLFQLSPWSWSLQYVPVWFPAKIIDQGDWHKSPSPLWTWGWCGAGLLPTPASRP